MSALGQKQTSRHLQPMSALPPKADILRCGRDWALFDHLVGTGKHRSGNCDAKSFGGLEINDEIELGRLLDRNFGGLAPLQYLNHEVCTQPKRFGERNAVRHQAASFRKRWKRRR